MKNKIILVFLFASILAATGIASAAVNDSDGDGIIDYLDAFPNEAEARGPRWSIGDNYNYTFTSGNFTAYPNSTTVEKKTIEIFDQNGIPVGSQEFYVVNRTHPLQGLMQLYVTTNGQNIYKFDFIDPNRLDITNIPPADLINYPLYEGKTWKHNFTQFMSNATINRTFKITVEATVIGREIIETPAGTFDCYIVDYKARNAATGDPWNFIKTWVFAGETPIPHIKQVMYSVSPDRSEVPSETWLINKFSLLLTSEAGDIFIVKTPAVPSPTPTKPATGFELMAAAIGIITAIYLRKRRF